MRANGGCGLVRREEEGVVIGSADGEDMSGMEERTEEEGHDQAVLSSKGRLHGGA